MLEFLTKILPNLMANKRYVNFGISIVQTLQMTLWSGAISFVLGLAFGIILVVTKKGAILENKIVYQILDKLINFFRSIPFIILLTGVMPLSRLIMGTSIDVRGAIVPLVFGTVPFFSRQIETALAEVDSGLV
ncbi:MAG: ABC transporter permease, partial [Treponema berlinense]|nr:ABC transporter permease [Treponema berlinense]